MQDGQHRAIPRGIKKAGPLPGTGQRPRLGLAIAHHRSDDQVGIVEGCAKGMRQDIAEFAALVNGAGRGHADMARDAAWRRKLAKQVAHPRHVLGDFGIDLGIGALQIDICH